MPNRHIVFPWSLANRTATMPDERRLLDARMPSLKIVLTGGSAVARGLDSTIQAAACEALIHRGVQTAYANRTEVVALRSPISDRVDAARRPVSSGALNPTSRSLHLCRVSRNLNLTLSAQPTFGYRDCDRGSVSLIGGGLVFNGIKFCWT